MEVEGARSSTEKGAIIQLDDDDDDSDVDGGNKDKPDGNKGMYNVSA
jgi:hypothetical protein